MLGSYVRWWRSLVLWWKMFAFSLKKSERTHDFFEIGVKSGVENRDTTCNLLEAGSSEGRSMALSDWKWSFPKGETNRSLSHTQAKQVRSTNWEEPATSWKNKHPSARDFRTTSFDYIFCILLAVSSKPLLIKESMVVSSTNIGQWRTLDVSMRVRRKQRAPMLGLE